MQQKNCLKLYLIIICLFTIPFLAIGQNQPKSNTEHLKLLPLDPHVRTGKLSNGFTYFIRRNTNPKDRVIFYLANKVGSILEDEDQRGLAHFMEHMNFNGTTNFPKNELVDYLQKAGVRFGADINAYTSFDETVYQLPLPSDKPEILNKGIEIMHDWAHGALLDPIEIDKERGVVLEEKRLGKGAGERMQRQYLPVVFNHSRYSQRLPIGLDTIIRNFKPETLNRFYRDWYRPDLQALIVVGDIDVDQMEKLIKNKFDDLKNPVNERARTKFTVNLTGKNQFVAVTDKEMTQTSIQVMIKHKAPSLKNESDYQRYIEEQLFNSMLTDRYKELSEQKDVPFLSGTAGITGFIGGLEAYNANTVTKPGEIKKGFKTVWRETERLKRWGFIEKELDEAKKSYLKRITASLKGKNTAYSPNLVNEYLQYFLKDVAAPGIDAEYALAKNDLPNITLAMLNKLTKQYITDVNRDIIIMAPENEKATLPTEAIILRWMTEVSHEKLTLYQDDFIDQPLLTKQPLPGKIVKQEALDGVSATQLLLSNGVKVILKPVKFSENYVLFKGFSPGGSSLYKDADYQSAAFAAYLTAKAGLGAYDFNHLNKFLSGSNIAMSPYISDYSQGIQGGAATDELETLLQMTYLYFTQPKIDTGNFKNFIEQSKAGLINRKENPNNVFDDTVNTIMGNYSVRRTPLTLIKLDQINLQRSHEIFKERFSDASGFTFTFVGDFDTDKIKPLIEKYLASLPSSYKHEQPKDLGIHPPAGKMSKTVYKGLEQKATVRLSFSNEFSYSVANNLQLDALAEVLQIRLIERLREEESGVYAPSVYVRYSKIPAQRYSFVISFGCGPENVEKLIASALEEIKRLQTNGPSAINLEKFKAENQNVHETNLRKIDFWSGYFTDQILNDESLNEVNTYKDDMQKVTIESVKEAAKNYLDGTNFIRLVLVPEKTGAN
jgi:zinc protease